MLQGTRWATALIVLASVLILVWTPAEARTQPVDLSRDSLFPFSMLCLPGDPFAHAQPLLNGGGSGDPAAMGDHGRLQAPAADSTGRSPDRSGPGGGSTASRPGAGWTGALQLFPPAPPSVHPSSTDDRPHAG